MYGVPLLQAHLAFYLLHDAFPYYISTTCLKQFLLRAFPGQLPRLIQQN